MGGRVNCRTLRDWSREAESGPGWGPGRGSCPSASGASCPHCAAGGRDPRTPLLPAASFSLAVRVCPSVSLPAFSLLLPTSDFCVHPASEGAWAPGLAAPTARRVSSPWAEFLGSGVWAGVRCPSTGGRRDPSGEQLGQGGSPGPVCDRPRVRPSVCPSPLRRQVPIVSPPGEPRGVRAVESARSPETGPRPLC